MKMCLSMFEWHENVFEWHENVFKWLENVFEWLENVFECIRVTRKYFGVWSRDSKIFSSVFECVRVFLSSLNHYILNNYTWTCEHNSKHLFSMFPLTSLLCHHDLIHRQTRPSLSPAHPCPRMGDLGWVFLRWGHYFWSKMRCSACDWEAAALWWEGGKLVDVLGFFSSLPAMPVHLPSPAYPLMGAW